MKSTDAVIQSLTEEHQLSIAGVTEENKMKCPAEVVLHNVSALRKEISRPTYYRSIKPISKQK